MRAQDEGMKGCGCLLAEKLRKERRSAR